MKYKHMAKEKNMRMFISDELNISSDRISWKVSDE